MIVFDIKYNYEMWFFDVSMWYDFVDIWII